jgi:RHS repeat-associated protein
LGTVTHFPSDNGPSTRYARYTYLGAGTIVQVDHPAVSGGLVLTYKGVNDGSYPGFDRFGRVVWQNWTNTATGMSKDRYFYGYDRASNRLWRAERRVARPVTEPLGNRDEGYVYDGLNRLKMAGRGVLSGTRSAGQPFAPWSGDFTCNGLINVDDYNTFSYGVSHEYGEWYWGDLDGNGVVDVDDYDTLIYFYTHPPVRSVTKSWSYGLDALGNWGSFVTTTTGTVTLNQTRTHNAVNEIDVDADHANTPGASIAASVGDNWVDPKYDAAGNMTSGPKPGAETTRMHLKYDAWNHLAKVSADDNGSPGTTVAEYRYDGLGRRIVKLIPNGANWDRTDFYYNEAWQCLEERKATAQADKETVATAAKVQWLWDVRYIDAPVCRWRDDNSDGDFADAGETLYYCNDANMNVTALVNAADGAVVERYQYEPYGSVTVCNSAWAPVAGNASAYSNEILFAGYRYDPETGLYDVRNRTYWPNIGRWGQEDPVGTFDCANLYLYSRAEPTCNVDPLGLTTLGAATADYAQDALTADEISLINNVNDPLYTALIVKRCEDRIDARMGQYVTAHAPAVWKSGVATVITGVSLFVLPGWFKALAIIPGAWDVYEINDFFETRDTIRAAAGKAKGIYCVPPCPN